MRTTELLSELELTTLMYNTNHIAAILDHLQGVVGDMRTIQVQEQGRLLTTSGESASLEIVATQVAERTLDEEFSDLNLSCVIEELEDFGNDVSGIVDRLDWGLPIRGLQGISFSTSHVNTHSDHKGDEG